MLKGFLERRSTPFLLVRLRDQMVLWVVGLNGLLLLAWPLLARAWRTSRGWRRSGPVEWTVVGMVCASTFSLATNVVINGGDLVFVAGTVFNILVVALFGVAIMEGRRLGGRALADHLVTLPTALLLTGIIVVAYVHTLRNPGFGVDGPTLLGLFVTIPGDSIVGAVDTLSVVRRDWLFTGLPRITVLARYPAATAIVLLCFSSALLMRLRSGMARGVGEAVVLVLVLATLTRSVIVPWVVLSAFSLLLAGPTLRRWVFPVALLALGSALLAADWSEILTLVGEARRGSTQTRLSLYEAAFSDQSPFRLLIGHGGKLDIVGKSLKIGTHSTVVGAYVKGGALLLGLTLAMMASVAWQVVRPLLHNRTLPYSVLVRMRLVGCSLGWMLWEDLDADPLVAILVGLFIGELIALGDRLRPGRREGRSSSAAAPSSVPRGGSTVDVA